MRVLGAAHKSRGGVKSKTRTILKRSGIGLPAIAVSLGGGGSIVNATSWDSVEGYRMTNLPSMRMIVDLSNLNNSVTVHTTGQSGHAYHPHYIDMAQMWASNQYYSMLWDKNAVMANMEGHLVLTPT